MPDVELSAGTVTYTDSGGSGPPVVLLHGLLMDASLWDEVVVRLPDVRCVVPTLPLGAHRHAVRADADLSLPGIAALVDELLAHLDLRDVTLVGNDTGGALVQLVMTGPGSDRLGRVVLASCEAFGNLPPGLTGRAVTTAGRLPPALFGAFMQQLRVKAVRRSPVAFGWLTKRGDAVTRRWLDPLLQHADIRRDAVRVLRALADDRTLLVRTATRLPEFDKPALVVWAAQDRVMPPAHGRRLAELLPQGRYVEVDDAYTLLPLDQPERFAALVDAFVHGR